MIALAAAAAILLVGCSSTLSYIPGAEVRPPLLLATAYTRGGCVEKLKAEAERRDVKIEITKVITELGVGAFSFPFFHDYLCHGEIQSPAAAK